MSKFACDYEQHVHMQPFAAAGEFVLTMPYCYAQHVTDLTFQITRLLAHACTCSVNFLVLAGIHVLCCLIWRDAVVFEHDSMHW